MIVILIMGLVLFIGVHMIPGFGTRATLVAKFGERGYKGLFALVAALGMGLIVYGKAYSDFVSVWSPPGWTRHLTMLLMLIAFLVFSAYFVPSNLRKFIRHPMLLFVVLWSAAHLLVNGDLASIILFASFLIFAVIKIVSQNRRQAFVLPDEKSNGWTVASVIVGGGLYGGAVMYHHYFAGVGLY